MTTIRIEVAFALPDRQCVLPLEVAAGTTLYQAVLQSGIAARFPGVIDLDAMAMGVFGKLEKDPQARVLADGDRVEIYRPLTVDPKDARRARAAKKRAGK